VKIILDLLPVVVFFGVFKIAKTYPQLAQSWLAPLLVSAPATADASDLAPAILATVSATAATLVQVGWLLARRARVPTSVWLSAGLMVVLGTLTVVLQNPWFIKWKPTLLYWAFSGVLAGGQWIWHRNLLGALFSNELVLPAPVWDRLSVAWTLFFIVLGAANLFVAYNFSTATWVDFKTFGLLGFTLAFSIGTGVYVARHIKATES